MNNKERDNIAIANALYNRNVALDEREESLKYREREISIQKQVITRFLEKYSHIPCSCECKCKVHTATRNIAHRVRNAMKYG